MPLQEGQCVRSALARSPVRWQPGGRSDHTPCNAGLCLCPPTAGATRILHPQPLLHHVPVCSGVAHPGAERPSTFLSLLEVSLEVGLLCASSYLLGHRPSRDNDPQTDWLPCASLPSLPFGDLFSVAFFASYLQMAPHEGRPLSPAPQPQPTGIVVESSCSYSKSPPNGNSPHGCQQMNG